MKDLERLAERANRAIKDHQDFKKAGTLFMQYLKGLRAIDPMPSFDKAEVALVIALCLSRTGRHDEALQWAQDQVDYMSSFTGDDWDQVQEGLLTLTEVAAEAGMYERAVEASDRALSALAVEEAGTTPRTATRTALKREWLALKLGTPGLGCEGIEIVLAYLSRLAGKNRSLKACKTLGDDARDIVFQEAQLYEARARLHVAGNSLDQAEADLKRAIKHYHSAWGEGSEMGDDARGLLQEVKALLSQPR